MMLDFSWSHLEEVSICKLLLDAVSDLVWLNNVSLVSSFSFLWNLVNISHLVRRLPLEC